MTRKAKSAPFTANAGYISVSAAALAPAMKTACFVVERRSTIPLLSCILIEASQAGLVIIGTDLDVSYTQTIGHECDSGAVIPFRVCVSAEKLQAIVAAADKEYVITFGYDASRLKISVPVAGGDDTEYYLEILSPEEFPAFVPTPANPSFVMEVFGLQALISTVRYAISNEETRYYLNGIFIHAGKAVLKAAATDGHRLGVWQGDLPDGANEMPDAIVSKKTVALLDAVLDRFDGDEPVSLNLSAAKIAVEIGDIQIVAKLIDGSFPDYTRVIPTGNSKRAIVDPARFGAAVRRVRLVASEKIRAITCAFDKDRIEISMASMDHGDARQTIRCEMAGEPLTIAFNAQYLIDALERMAAYPLISIMLEGPADPAWFKPGDDAARPSHVLMPMKV